MKLNKKYQIVLDFDEAVALKKIMGNVSDKTKQSLGLDARQIELMHELYNLLPYENEDEKSCQYI